MADFSLKVSPQLLIAGQWALAIHGKLGLSGMRKILTYKHSLKIIGGVWVMTLLRPGAVFSSSVSMRLAWRRRYVSPLSRRSESVGCTKPRNTLVWAPL